MTLRIVSWKTHPKYHYSNLMTAETLGTSHDVDPFAVSFEGEDAPKIQILQAVASAVLGGERKEVVAFALASS